MPTTQTGTRAKGQETEKEILDLLIQDLQWKSAQAGERVVHTDGLATVQATVVVAFGALMVSALDDIDPKSAVDFTLLTAGWLSLLASLAGTLAARMFASTGKWAEGTSPEVIAREVAAGEELQALVDYQLAPEVAANRALGDEIAIRKLLLNAWDARAAKATLQAERKLAVVKVASIMFGGAFLAFLLITPTPGY